LKNPTINNIFTQEDINNIVKKCNEKFNNECSNLSLFGKKIYFSQKLVQNYSIDFWHMGSLENKDLHKNNRHSYYNIKPCNNTLMSNRCTNCTQHTFEINVRNTVRDICAYRLQSIKFFKIAIENANEKSDNIKVWKTEDYSTKRQRNELIKIRFQENEVDYLIILKENGDIYYFVTAYLVFEQREKNDLDKEYNSRDSKKIK